MQDLLDVSKTTQKAGAAGYTTNTEAWEFARTTPGLRDLYDANHGAGAWTEGYKGQAAYIAYQRTLTQNPKYKDQKLAEFQVGVSDESIFGLTGQVSGIDRFSTNTTLGQRLGYSATPPVKPGEKQTFYCVDFEDGSKEVITVTYKDNEQPVAPAVGSTTNGKVVKAVSAAYIDLTTATENCKPKDEPGDKEAYYCVDYHDMHMIMHIIIHIMMMIIMIICILLCMLLCILLWK